MPPMYEEYSLERNGEEVACSVSYTRIKELYESLKAFATYTSLKVIQKVMEWGGHVRSSMIILETSK